jgi:hypothetical protein
VDRTYQSGAVSVLADPAESRPRDRALDLCGHAPAVHLRATRWPLADNMSRMSHLAAEATASDQAPRHQLYPTRGARSMRGFDSGRGAW